MVKKIAAKRGVNLQTHQSIRDFVKEMSDQYLDIDLRSDFVTSGYLHSNFYEDGMSSWEVEGTAERAKRPDQETGEFVMADVHTGISKFYCVKA